MSATAIGWRAKKSISPWATAVGFWTMRRCPASGHCQSLRSGEPRLHQLASFHEAWDAVCSANVEHRLGDPLGVVGPEAELLHGRHLCLEEQICLAECLVEGAWEHPLQHAAVAVAADVAQEQVDCSRRVTGLVGGKHRLQGRNDLF